MFLETPLALWLFPVGVIALLLLQLWQARRHELLVGSLLVWRRVAEKERAKPRRRLVLDRSFWLQSATLLTLALAWANPVWQDRSTPGRRFVVLVDNGPASRARQDDGNPVWEHVRETARAFLAGLTPNDRVILCTSIPVSRHLPGNDGATPSRALEELVTVSPGLTPSSTDDLWRFVLNEARLWTGGDGTARSLVFSPRPAPREAAEHTLASWVAVPSGKVSGNVALAAFGSGAAFDPGPQEVLIQVRNFGTAKATGSISCETSGQPPPAPQRVELAPGGVEGVVFQAHTPCPLRFVWKSDGGPDALPEDDTVTVMPRQFGPPRVRWHGSAPHLQDLFRLALNAQEVPLDAKETADLEVFTEGLPPESPAGGHAVLLLAPPGEYGPFEVTGEMLERPVARLGEADALTRGLAESPAGLDWPVAKARAIRQVGDLRILAQDSAGHLLAARFTLKDRRPGYVLAFVPGEGLGWPRERKLDSPGLATLLLRLLREASGAAEPYAFARAEHLERAEGKPLPLDWKPVFDGKDQTGQGVLDARTSEVLLAGPSAKASNVGSLAPAATPERHALWPIFVLLAILLMLIEVRAGSIGATTAAITKATTSCTVA